MEEVIKAYIAGIIDGEGCIHISRRFDKRNNRMKFYHKLDVIVSMKNRSAIDVIREAYGGTLTTKRASGRLEYADRQYWRLVIGSNNALTLLQDIVPYLHVKKSSAKWAILFQKHVDENRKSRWLGTYNTVLPERETIYTNYRAAAETERESGLPNRSSMRQSTPTG